MNGVLKASFWSWGWMVFGDQLSWVGELDFVYQGLCMMFLPKGADWTMV